MAIVFTVEHFTEDIELFYGGIEGDGDIFEVSPRIYEVFESILIEEKAFNTHISTITFEDIVIRYNAFDGSTAGGMRGISWERFRKRSAFRSGGAAGLKVIFF